MNPPAEFDINGLHLMDGVWYRVVSLTRTVGRSHELDEPTPTTLTVHLVEEPA